MNSLFRDRGGSNVHAISFWEPMKKGTMYIYGIVTIVIAIVKVTLFINEVLETQCAMTTAHIKKNA